MAKRLVFCFDGTWNRLSADVPTNVAFVAQMVRPVARDGTPQIVYYDEGIGANTWFGRRIYEGATGKGMERKLREAYRFLIFNYERGDEIFAFGFSRGAFTARSFIGFIRHAGILDVISANKIDKALELYKTSKIVGKTGEESGQALRFRFLNCKGVCVSEEDAEFRRRVDPAYDPAKVPILEFSYLGVWDTVRALGVPDFLPFSRWINEKYGFHDAVLTSKIKSARHAVALDEERPTFRATLFGRERVAELTALAGAGRETPFDDWAQPYQEKWFPGTHGSVGGGGAHRGLSDGALFWVLSGARRAGLQLRSESDARAFLIAPNSFDHLSNQAARTIWDRWPLKWLRELINSPRPGPTGVDELGLATFQRWFADSRTIADGKLYRPGALRQLAGAIDLWPHARMPSFKFEHIFQAGESLSKLAKRYLGEARRYPEIFAANRDRIEDPDYLYVGMPLRMPTAEPDGREPMPLEAPPQPPI
jgi:uncharacterized protein (DUF2235 family)